MFAPCSLLIEQPKTYFAAERTFIQWISAALLLITVAAILLSLSNDEGMASGYASGLVLTVLAMVVTLYALVVYCRRLYLLGNGKPYGYVDYIGPAVLAMAVAGGIGASLYVAVYLHNPPAISTAAVIAEPGNCIRHDFTGISLLEYQPSDVVVDEARDMLIIPSQSKLTSVPINMNHTASDLLVLTELAGADMEAVTYGNGTLFALSEDESSSMLLAFEWSHGNYSDVEDLHLVGR